MTFLLLASAAAAATAPQPAVSHQSRFTPPASHCPRTTQYYAWQRGQRMEPRKLTELPDANFYRAVYRVVDGCEVPVIVRYGVTGR